MQKQFASALVSLVALGVVAVSAAVKVQSQHDPKFDFTPLRTWMWHPQGPGNAVRIVSKEDDSAAFKQRVEPRLLPIVEAEFVRRGFPQAKGTPDFYVTYYAVVTAGNSSQFMGQFLSLPQWGLPPLTPQTQSLEYFPRGSLILDITHPASNAVVWRGLAQADLEWSESDNKREQRVREAARELLKRFPPKPTRGQR